MREGRNGGKLKTGGVHKNSGRPKKIPALDTLMDKVMGEEKDGISAMEAILKSLRAKAAKGDIKAAQILLDRAYGRPKQHIDHTTKGEAIRPPIEWINPDEAP